MTRVKRGNIARNRRKKILKLVQGFRGSSSKLYRIAQQRAIKALSNSYKDRKRKKREFGNLWVSRINAKTRFFGLNYSEFQKKKKENQLILNRKICGQLALYDKNAFEALINFIH